MKKLYYIVDSENCQICYTKSVTSAFWDYDEPPMMRKGGIIVRVGIDCVLGGLCIGFINSQTSFLQLSAFNTIAWGLICLALVLFVIGAVYSKLANNERNAEYKCIVGNKIWPDPYNLLDKYLSSDTTQKLYYIVDSETNAIVDVKRLGKWGQAYVEWRGKRQKRNHKEGGA